ncbi:MAG: ATP-binding protein [Flavobacteriales bacterium]|nr:ATP-binding protein [Flavobacteriales bacterium]
MRTKFSPSINLVRDGGQDYGYLATANAKQIAEEIVRSEKSGAQAFQLIGSFGTGKSAFLLAFANALRGQKTDLPVKASKKEPAIISLVGEYRSLSEFLADHFELKKGQKGYQYILDAIHERYEKQGRLYLIIDEFGKFLEHAVRNKPEEEMYFVQQLAEYFNDEDRNVTLLVTLHQSMEAYAQPAQRNEWKKVQGRLRALPFNEPVSQLVQLAAQQLSKAGASVPKGVDVTALAKISAEHHLFDEAPEAWTKEELSKLYPLDLIATQTLTKALQVCGQNSRSLFTFLRVGNITPSKGNSFFGLPQVFDHLNSEFYSYLRSAGNPMRAQWQMLWGALERVDADFGKDRKPYEDIVKTVGLLQLFGGKGASVDEKFLSAYLSALSGAKDTKKRLSELTARKIVLFVKHRASFRMTEGTDLDFESALSEASEHLEAIEDVAGKLGQHFNRQYVLAKEATYLTGSPRVFEYQLSDKAITTTPKGMVDGYINLVFGSSTAQVQKVSGESKEPIVYGVFMNTAAIRTSLQDIEKAQRVIDKNAEDRVAVRELRKIQQHHAALLDHFIHEALFTGNTKHVRWFHAGKEQPVKNVRSFNRLLSTVVQQAYPDAPIFRNELINREKVSPTASTARKDLFDLVCEQWEKPDLGFDKDFPAQRAIYTTLLKENGMHRKGKDGYDLFPPAAGSSFTAVWKACDEFLAESRHGRKDVTELMERLGERPFKLKYGLVELWVPLYLFIKRGDYALYQENAFVPQLTGPILYMMTRRPQDFQVKAFLMDGVRLRLFNRYKSFLGKEEVKHLTNGDLQDVTRPFLSFYRALNPYTQRTEKVSPEARALRAAIEHATDPEKTFFEDLPNALHLSLEEVSKSDEQLGRFISFLSTAIDHLQQATPRLVERIDAFIGEEVLSAGQRFPDTRGAMVRQLEGMREHQLLDHLKPLYKRIMAPLDQSEAWISSVAEGAIGKPLSKFTDRDEDLLKERLLTMYRELTSLADLHRVEEDPKGAPAVRLQITTSSKGTHTETIQYPAKKKAQVEKLMKELKSKLGNDSSVDRAALAWLLNEELGKA